MKIIHSFLFLLISGVISFGQAPKRYTSSEIFAKIQKLNVLGSAMYVAAHPDDENTTMISYLANARHINTAYLSLTRGDGGQNLIGPELKELLGVIRTQELLAAREIDNGQQFFSRANDFGYSKSPHETFDIWNKEDVLSDMIWTIRKFRPDIIINRFNHDLGSRTHGHHTASAALSYEAFEKYNDPTVFPEQLKYVDTWQPSRLYWNTSWWFYGSRKKFEEA
ncbi:MAG: PIG-L family deacetylase, partial [Bacteroidota bacterium]